MNKVKLMSHLLPKKYRKNFSDFCKVVIFRSRKTLSVFEFHLAEHCNLNCAGCDHFSPIAQEEYADINKVEKDIERLAFLTKSNIKEIRLLGGEPLLNKDAIPFFVMVRRHFPKSQILLFTNAILLPKQSIDFWQSCKDNKITITASLYPIKIDLDTIKEKCKEYDIPFYWQSAGKKDDMWRCKLDLNGNCNPKSNFFHCPHNTWRFLREGRIYPCSFLPNIHHFNKYFKKELPITEGDSFDIYKAKNLKEILKFLSKPIPFCRYCDIDGFTYGHKYAISKKEIGEWT